MINSRPERHWNFRWVNKRGLLTWRVIIMFSPETAVVIVTTSNGPSTWQHQLSTAFGDIQSLCQYLQITVDSLPVLTQNLSFPIRIPKSFADCMEKGNPHDPLLRQVIPLIDETLHAPGFTDDPVGDLSAVAAGGVLHKYDGRVLLITTGACAIHCRYCFRRNFPYAENQMTASKEEQALNYIAANNTIREVILSGGDPLICNDEKLGRLLQRLTEISHIQRVRIHSRLPIVLPERVNQHLIAAFQQASKPIILVVHANHANELSAKVEYACQLLKKADVTLLNQSVLLKNVNDSVEVLCQLSEKLFSFGILPYYLHLLDKASGTHHFAVEEPYATQLLSSVKKYLPGYLIPRLVKDLPNTPHKISLMS